MKKLIPILLLFLAATMQAQPDTCHPTFKEIYDFNVGDVFVYESQGSEDCGAMHPTISGKTKIKILDKKIINDTTIKYYRENIVSIHPNHCSAYWTWGTWKYTDSITYIDSANHLLNKCNGDSIFLEVNYLYNKVKIYTFNDSVKTIHYEDTALSHPFKNEIYKKGLGRVRHEEMGIEFGGSDTLIAYIKNNDTIGIIPSDDEILRVGITQSYNDKSILIYPNPTRENFTIELPMEYEACRIELISADGSVVLSNRFLNSGQNVISIGNIVPGFYVVRIAAGGDVFYKKLFID